MKLEQIALIISGLMFLLIGLYYQDEKRVKELMKKRNDRLGVKTDSKKLIEAAKYWKKIYLLFIGFGIFTILLPVLFPEIF